MAIAIRDVSKTYGSTRALNPVDLDIKTGTVHAFVGENGAGKSTLLKILAGAVSPTSGSLALFGEPVSFETPRIARKHGVVAVYQELTVLPNMTAVDNVFLGQYPRRLFKVDRRSMLDAFKRLSQRMGVSIRPDARAGDLSIADQQVLEIMRALHFDARVLLLDEPTASLALHEREALGRVIRSLAKDGVTVVWISHDLEEVLALSDAVTVFRDGSLIETRPASQWDHKDLVAAMLGGRSVNSVVHRGVLSGSVALQVRDLTLPGVLQNVSFHIREGEILGIAGLMGSGRSEILRCLIGLEPNATAEISFQGRTSGLPENPRSAGRMGIALAPEDRKGQGLVLPLTTAANIAMPDWRGLSEFGLMRPSREVSYASSHAVAVGMDTKYLDRTIGTLSGGNQQKAVIAKWIGRNLRLFLVDEPTRGIDIAAKSEIYQLLDRISQEGTSVLLVSSEFEELIDVCDRVLVLVEGQVVDEIDRNELTEESILSSIFEVAK